MLERGAGLSKIDPGVHYQLFTAYSRLKRKSDADHELALFKQLEEARKQREGLKPAGAMTKDAPAPPELPASISGGSEKRPPL